MELFMQYPFNALKQSNTMTHLQKSIVDIFV